MNDPIGIDSMDWKFTIYKSFLSSNDFIDTSNLNATVLPDGSLESIVNFLLNSLPLTYFYSA